MACQEAPSRAVQRSTSCWGMQGSAVGLGADISTIHAALRGMVVSDRAAAKSQ